MESVELQLGVTAPAEQDDRALVERLMAAFRRSHEDLSYDQESQWLQIRQLHEPVAQAIRDAAIDVVQDALHHPNRGHLFYGFEDLGAWTDEAYGDPYHCQLYALHCSQLLERLARALGVLGVPNPEAPERTLASRTSAELVELVQRALDIAIAPPEIYPGYRGLLTPLGVMGERVINALYCAYRIRQLTAGIAAPRILEIGAGLGRVAHYSYLMGMRDYTLVDLPMTNLAHGHFLGRALGPDKVILDGEPGWKSSPDKIKLMTAERFLAGDGLQTRFDLVVNVDSLTEIGAGLAATYFRHFARLAPCLLSINHEVNEYRVQDLYRANGGFDRCDRMTYWLREGYVEEIYRRGARRRRRPALLRRSAVA